MKREIAHRWADAIESGEYRLCKGMMRSDCGFCYLGILADLWLKDTGQEWVGPVGDPVHYTLPNGVSLLPVRTISGTGGGDCVFGDWAGCKDPDPLLIIAGRLRRMSEWNDAPAGVTPKQVADAIRSQYSDLDFDSAD